MPEAKKPELDAVFKDKSALSVAIATLILLLISFFGFRYFSNQSSPENDLNGDGVSDTLVEDSTDEVDGEDSSDVEESGEVASETDQVNGSGGANDSIGTWTAIDYQPSQLEGTSHTVVSGDTLWELAEAYTGNPYNWTQIAEANDIGYLPNGNPLIVPGQVLTIPSV